MSKLSRTRGPGQLRLLVLDALWRQGEATSQRVQQTLGGPDRIALTTVATILQRLDKAGDVTHRLDGRQHVYRALVSREQLRAAKLKGMLHQLFAGDPISLVAQLIESGEMTRRDLARVERLLARHPRERVKP
jgi:predicted transcriptional regulator